MRHGLALLGMLVVFTLGACQRGDEAAPAVAVADLPPPGFVDDVVRICDVMMLSGADQLPENQRTFAVAEWLGANIETEAGHDLLVDFQQTPDAGKAAMLEARSSKAGLLSCALASSWGH